MPNYSESQIIAQTAELATIRTLMPNLRLGQLLSNAIPKNKDLYYMPDEELLLRLREYYATIQKR